MCCSLLINRLPKRLEVGRVLASIETEIPGCFVCGLGSSYSCADETVPKTGISAVCQLAICTSLHLTHLSGSRPYFAIMEIGHGCWPLFLHSDVRSIGMYDHRRVHDHGNYGYLVWIKRVGAGALKKPGKAAQS